MHIEVFVAQNDIRCQAVRQFLDGFGLKYTELDISKKEVQEDFQKRLPGTNAVPQLFIDGEHAGGYEDLLKITLEFARRNID